MPSTVFFKAPKGISLAPCTLPPPCRFYQALAGCAEAAEALAALLHIFLGDVWSEVRKTTARGVGAVLFSSLDHGASCRVWISLHAALKEHAMLQPGKQPAGGRVLGWFERWGA